MVASLRSLRGSSSGGAVSLLAPWAEAVELEWEAAVHPAFTKLEHLPADAHVQASMTGVEWLRGRSGLLLTEATGADFRFLDPRWVDTGSELSNCSYGECKARLWQPEGEQGDGRGGILGATPTNPS